MATYPSAVISLPTHSDTTDTIFAADINIPNAEIVAVETGLLSGFQHDLVPLSDDTQSVGGTAKRWLKGWFQDLDVDGTLTLASGMPVASGGTGATTLTAHGVLVGEGTSAIAATVAGTAGQLLTGNASADPTFQDPSSVGASMVLLKAGNGTDTNAAATTVDSIVLPVLTANDTIIVEWYAESVTQTTVAPGLFHVTDATSILSFTGGNFVASQIAEGRVMLKQRQATPTSYVAGSVAFNVSGGGALLNNQNLYSATASWVSGWTLGLHHGGVTSGGTFKWQWSIYRLLGQ